MISFGITSFAWAESNGYYCYDEAGDGHYCYQTYQTCKYEQKKDNIAESPCYNKNNIQFNFFIFYWTLRFTGINWPDRLAGQILKPQFRIHMAHRLTIFIIHLKLSWIKQFIVDLIATMGTFDKIKGLKKQLWKIITERQRPRYVQSQLVYYCNCMVSRITVWTSCVIAHTFYTVPVCVVECANSV